MRSAIGFFSLVAFGFLVGGMLVVGLSANGGPHDVARVFAAENFDLGSLILGILVGCLLSLIAGISWSELPGRFVRWVLAHEKSFYRLSLGAVFLGILFFY